MRFLGCALPIWPLLVEPPLIATLWETVCLFLALAISDWLLPRTPIHLRACRLPVVRMEIHYSAET